LCGPSPAKTALFPCGDLTRGTFLGSLRSPINAMHLGVHLRGNQLEMSLMLVASHFYLKNFVFTQPQTISDPAPEPALP